nr:hypothetical protein CFP56_73748 [Quercus suber]
MSTTQGAVWVYMLRDFKADSAISHLAEHRHYGCNYRRDDLTFGIAVGSSPRLLVSEVLQLFHCLVAKIGTRFRRFCSFSLPVDYVVVSYFPSVNHINRRSSFGENHT